MHDGGIIHLAGLCPGQLRILGSSKIILHRGTLHPRGGDDLAFTELLQGGKTKDFLDSFHGLSLSGHGRFSAWNKGKAREYDR